MKNHLRFRKLSLIGLLTVAVLAVPGAPLHAEEAKPTGDITTAVLSQYI
ncbi:MAG: hypothetical protein ACYC5X_17290 [Syntrophales bacterium]